MEEWPIGVDAHSKATKGSQCIRYFCVENDSFFYKDHLYICRNSQLKQKVVFKLHTFPIGRHSRFLKTYHTVKKDFFWEGPKSNVWRFVTECLVFQQNKVETIKTSSLLHPLDIPYQRWEEVSMDFITGLPKLEGSNVTMAVVDITKCRAKLMYVNLVN